MTRDYFEQIIAPGDRFSALARQTCINSFDNSPAIDILRSGEEMRAMDGFRWKDHILKAMMEKEIHQAGQSDGAGGKLQFHCICSTPEAFKVSSHEVAAMNLEDFTVRGGKPVMVFSSNIDVKGINDENWHLCEAVQAGMGDLLKKNQLVLLTGETAVMPHNITAFCDTNSPDQLIMTWSATVLGLAADGKPKNGSTVTPNMTIIGFCEDGYRCNGGTKITNLILDTWGEDFRKHSEAMDFIKMAAIPSQVYGQFIAEMNGWKEDGLYVPDDVLLAGAAHITGGGIWGKLPEALPEGVGAHLYDLPQPNPLLLKAQQLSLDTESTLSDYQCYRTFNGGFGMILIVQNHHAASVMEQASQAGIKAVKIGKTIQSDKNEIIIESAFHFGGQLSSLDPR